MAKDFGRGIDGDRAFVCVARLGDEPHLPPCETEIQQRFRAIRTRFRGDFELFERFRVAPEEPQRRAQVGVRVAVRGQDRKRASKTPRGVLGLAQCQQCRPEIVVGLCEVRFDTDGAFEKRDRLARALRIDEQGADVCENAGIVRRQRRCRRCEAQRVSGVALLRAKQAEAVNRFEAARVRGDERLVEPPLPRRARRFGAALTRLRKTAASRH